MPRQLILDLPVHTALGQADFFVSASNAQAVAVMQGDWPQGKLVLTGPLGAGKTHLARVWAAQTGAAVLPPDLASLDLAALNPAAVVVDDADQLAGTGAETALFHLHNLVLAAGGRLLMTGQTPPTRWPIRLPDLASRLQATATTALDAPDDGLLMAVLVKLFSDRQLAVPPKLLPYIAARMERSLATAQALVAALDARALAEGRAITRAMAAEWLDIAGKDEP